MEWVRVLTMPAEFTSSTVYFAPFSVIVYIVKYSRYNFYELNYFQMKIRNFKVLDLAMFFTCKFEHHNSSSNF